MQYLIPILMLMTYTIAQGQDGKAHTTKKTFSRETIVTTYIDADPAIVWALLTNAADYPRWNSTILSMEGRIAPKEKIRLVSTLAPERSFKLKIKDWQPEQRLAWGDGKGQRTFALETQDGGTVFTMTEKIGGLMFPLYAKYLPDFDESFELFAADLKREAELIQAAKQ